MEIDKAKLRKHKVRIALLSSIPITRLDKFIEGYDNLNYREQERVFYALREVEYARDIPLY